VIDEHGSQDLPPHHINPNPNPNPNPKPKP
jgi:hypothetical protein